MTHFKFAVFILLAALCAAPAAHALSTESSSNAFKGGNASNFADPDEQQPAFVMGITGNGSSSQRTQQQPAVSIDQNAQREQYMGLSQSFDHAYAHQQQ